MYGIPTTSAGLLDEPVDSLAAALRHIDTWSVEAILDESFDRASNSDDYSLVALACLANGAVVLTALRESVALYSLPVALSGPPSKPEYIWNVDAEIQRRAEKFIEELNSLAGCDLPEPTHEHAAAYWTDTGESKLVGRRIRIGLDDRTTPVRHYHWEIVKSETGELIVRDFWDTKVHTSEYRDVVLRRRGREDIEPMPLWQRPIGGLARLYFRIRYGIRG